MKLNLKKRKLAGALTIVIITAIIAGSTNTIYIAEAAHYAVSRNSKLPFIISGQYEPSAYAQCDVDSETVKWFCSCYAIYTTYSNKTLDMVGGLAEWDRYIIPEMETALANDWGITDRGSALEKISALLESGHRSKYHDLIRQLDYRGWLDLSEENFQVKIENTQGITAKEQNKMLCAYRAYRVNGLTAIDAWDYSRVLQLLGDCYQLGYINLDECLNQSLLTAQTIQAEFEGWDEFAESYLTGYEYWKGENPDDKSAAAKERWDIYETFKVMEDGPYSIPFDMQLSNTWTGHVGNPETTDEYCTVQNKNGENSVKIKIPKERDFRLVYSDGDPVLISVDDESYKTIAAFYTLYDEEDNVSGIAKSIRDEDTQLPERVGTDIKAEVNGREITYLYYEYRDEYFWSHNTIIMWTKIEGKGILACKVTESSTSVRLEYPNSDSAVFIEMMLGDIE